MSIQTNLAPRMFAQIVLETICGEPSLVTDGIINSINRWLGNGNKKDFYSADDITVLVDWVMTGK